MAPLEGPEYWSSRFAKTRARLYWLTVAFFALVVCFLSFRAILGEAIEPVVKWLPELVRFLVPGLPANLVEIAMTFPVTGLLLIAVALLIGWMNRRIRIEEAECAFRSWASHRTAPCKCPSKDWKPELRARAVVWIGPVFPLLAIMKAAISLGLLLAAMCFALCSSSMEAVPFGGAGGSKGTESPACCASAGLKRLDPGRTVRVVIAAKRARNETGFLLEKGESYTARYLSHDRWKDGGREAKPSGIDFHGLKGYLAVFLERLRPYSAGRWFQVVGRIDRGHKVFPVLSDRQDCEGRPFEFVAPADGELVLLVNDVWYSNNTGFMTLEIGRPAPRQQRGMTDFPCRTLGGDLPYPASER